MPVTQKKPTLADLMRELGELPHQYSVELDERESAVYVNYDFNVAVVIEMGSDQPEYEGMFVLMAMAWDQTHGVESEHYIGVLADARVAAQVAVQFAKDHETL